jgi:N-acetylglucosamine-6-phosphate deacetylase
MLALTARFAYTPEGLHFDPLILIEDGTIVEVSSRAHRELPTKHVDFGDTILAPGFIDIHVHGGAGFDVMHASDSELPHFERFLAKHGVTSYLATTVTAPEDVTLQSLARLGRAVQNGHCESNRARPLGIHLEGPFISHAKRGVHPVDSIRPADTKLFDRFFDAAGGAMKLMTFAPELPNGGIAAGAKTATHTFNAMRSLDHRDPGVLGATLTSADLMADIIADGVHVHPEMVKLFLESKGEDRAMLITDAISATGMPDGHYMLGNLEVEVRGDRCEHEGRLAGSVLTLDRAVRNARQFSGWRMERVVKLVTANPARLLGLPNKGRLAVGADADFVVLTQAGDIVRTVIGGRL